MTRSALRQWIWPFLLGGLAAGLVLVLPAPHLPHDDALPAAVDEPLGLAWTFREAEAEPGAVVGLLAVGEPTGTTVTVACDQEPHDRTLDLVRMGDALWRLDVPTGCAGDGLAVRPAAPGPRFGQDDHNATTVTVYAFEEGGELLASNAGATQRNRYRLYGDFVTLSDRPWYLGDGPVPEGMRVPQGYVRFAHDHLAGAPVGGVVWAHVPTHEYDWLTGPIWITARVDGLVRAA